MHPSPCTFRRSHNPQASILRMSNVSHFMHLNFTCPRLFVHTLGHRTIKERKKNIIATDHAFDHMTQSNIHEGTGLMVGRNIKYTHIKR